MFEGATASGGQSSWPETRSSGFPECAAATRQRTGPVGRVYTISVNETADPRLDGRALKRVAFSEAEIAERVHALGDAITAAYPDGELLVLGLLKGSFIFLSDLVRAIHRPLQVDFLVASSYGDATVSSGHVKLVYDPNTALEGKHILLVEDIVDSGRTLQKLTDLLQQRKPRSLEICALLHKPARTRVEVPIDYLGFTIEDKFVVGYGLDWAERYRNLPMIGVVEGSS